MNMGEPMMIKHADGSQTIAYGDALPYIYVEHELNHLFYLNYDHGDYALTVKWSQERKAPEFGVGKINEPDAEIPQQVLADAEQAVRDYDQHCRDKSAQQDFVATAGHVLEDTIQRVRGNWVLDEDGGSVVRRLGDYMVCVAPYNNQSWSAFGYDIYNPGRDRFDLERRSLDYVLMAANEWIESR
jgi:hypothetical protein